MAGAGLDELLVDADPRLRRIEDQRLVTQVGDGQHRAVVEVVVAVHRDDELVLAQPGQRDVGRVRRVYAADDADVDLAFEQAAQLVRRRQVVERHANLRKAGPEIAHHLREERQQR